MRIHGGKKDYYDTAMGFGLDPKLHYDRRSVELSRDEFEHLRNKPHVDLLHGLTEWRWVDDAQNHERNERVLVGFCGRLYPCIRVSVVGKDEVASAYTVEGLEVISLDYRNQIKRERKAIERFGRKHSASRSWGRKQGKDFLSQAPVQLDALFIELGVPVFTIRIEDRAFVVKLNDCLKDFQFYKMVEPYTAFQEISMYLGNQLARQIDPETVPDRYRIAQHGFDVVRSFRNMPRDIS